MCSYHMFARFFKIEVELAVNIVINYTLFNYDREPADTALEKLFYAVRIRSD